MPDRDDVINRPFDPDDIEGFIDGATAHLDAPEEEPETRFKGLRIVLSVDGKETVIEPHHAVSLEFRTTDPEPTSDNWRVITLWALDQRDSMPNDPVVCFAIGQEEYQVIAWPVGNHPDGKTGPTGIPVWWEYEL